MFSPDPLDVLGVLSYDALKATFESCVLHLCRDTLVVYVFGIWFALSGPVAFFVMLRSQSTLRTAGVRFT